MKQSFDNKRQPIKHRTLAQDIGINKTLCRPYWLFYNDQLDDR